jgi:hypothetical protein
MHQNYALYKFFTPSKVIYSNCIFDNNYANVSGGASSISTGLQITIFEDCVFKNNQAKQKGKMKNKHT